MEIIESFSILIDNLTTSLEKGKEINYSSVFVPKECAIGVFLSRLPKYKNHLSKKIKEEYKQRYQASKTSIFKEISSKNFEMLCKKLSKLCEISNAYFSRFQRNFIRNSIERTRKWTFKAVTNIQKEVFLCRLLMDSSTINFKLKLKEYTEDYSWQKFLNYLYIISLGFARISDRKLNKGTKEKLEEFLKRPSRISRFVCIENLYVSEPAQEKRTQIKLLNHSKLYFRQAFFRGRRHVRELFDSAKLLSVNFAGV